MAYSLYIDRNENFECDVSTKNASLKNAQARLIVKSEDINLLFEGEIDNGRCVVPIPKMKGLLEENTTGQMHLEIIVNDTYFNPWKDSFVVEEHTSVKVHVHEQKKNRSKPLMEVAVREEKPKMVSKIKEEKKIAPPEQQLFYLLERFGINKENVAEQKASIKQIISGYFAASPTLVENKKTYVRKALLMLR